VPLEEGLRLQVEAERERRPPTAVSGPSTE
jgi:hypothetical protein